MSRIQYIENVISPLFNKKIFDITRNRYLKCFTYHEVNEKPSDFTIKHNLNVYPEIFDKQLKFIKEHYKIISPTQLLHGKIDEDSALITFDDGFRGVKDYAKEILMKHNIHALIFINMDTVESGIQWAAMLSYMNNNNYSWMIKNKLTKNIFLNQKNKQIINKYFSNNRKEFEKAIKYSGNFLSLKDLKDMEECDIYFGNHLYNHYSCVEIDDNILAEEFKVNEKKLESSVKYLPFFAYPYGQPVIAYNSDTNSKVKMLNAKRIFSGIAYPNENINELIYRISMTNSIDCMSRFRVHCVVPELINYILKHKIINESI